MSEIRKEVQAFAGGDVCNEAADVANFAMMIADNFGDLKEG